MASSVLKQSIPIISHILKSKLSQATSFLVYTQKKDLNFVIKEKGAKVTKKFLHMLEFVKFRNCSSSKIKQSIITTIQQFYSFGIGTTTLQLKYSAIQKDI